MLVKRLWLDDFRSYRHLELELPSGLTCVTGANGVGKSNLIEAIGYLGNLKSFRGADTATMVRTGAQTAFVRAEVCSRGRNLLIEAELNRHSRGRVRVNRQRLLRSSDLSSAAKVSVFAPDDLVTIKGAPSFRRELIDDAVVSMWPRYNETLRRFGQILKQRNALLKRSGLKRSGNGLDNETTMMLDVWDSRLSAAGEELTSARKTLVDELIPFAAQAYRNISRSDRFLDISYEPVWFKSGLAAALVANRDNDLRRATTLVGPHRDDVDITLGGFPSRTHVSQGEQRTLALALRLGIHLLLSERFGEVPLLLLDDVFSELDDRRARSLLDTLPAGQTILTSASDLPAGAQVELVLEVSGGTVQPR